MKFHLLLLSLLLPVMAHAQQDAGIIKFPPCYSADVVTIMNLGASTHIINTKLFVDHEKERSEINGKIYPEGVSDSVIKLTRHDLGTEYCFSKEGKTYWKQPAQKLPSNTPNLNDWVVKNGQLDGIECIHYETKALDRLNRPFVSIWINKADHLPLCLWSAGGKFEKKWFHFSLKKPDSKIFELPEGYKEIAKAGG